MKSILIANTISLVASLLMVYSGMLKKKEEILYLHSIEKVLSVISNIVLRGITGAITNGIGLIRNILCYRDKLKIKQKLIIIILMSVISLCFNNLGIMGILPVLSTGIYTLFMDTKNIIKFKILSISTTFLWLIYNFYIMSYVAGIFGIFQIITNSIAILKLSREKKKRKNISKE